LGIGPDWVVVELTAPDSVEQEHCPVKFQTARDWAAAAGIFLVQVGRV
jgi:hypothetical protein